MSSPYAYRVSYIRTFDCVQIHATQFGSRASFIRIDREAWPAVVQAAAEVLTDERVAEEIAAIIDKAGEVTRDSG